MGSEQKEVTMASLPYAGVLEGHPVSLALSPHRLAHCSSTSHHCFCSFRSGEIDAGAPGVLHHRSDLFPLFTGVGLGLSPTLEKLHHIPPSVALLSKSLKCLEADYEV